MRYAILMEMRTGTGGGFGRNHPGSPARGLLLAVALAAIALALLQVANGDAAAGGSSQTGGAAGLRAPTASLADSDGDGFDDTVEEALGSDPSNGSKTPEHQSLPLTCGDGVDNDGDGQTDLNDSDCSLDSDEDGVDDLTEISLLSKPYTATGSNSTPEDISVAGSCSDGVDNDGDGATDTGTPPFIPTDDGCLDDDGDGHSDAREAAFGSKKSAAASRPENLNVRPTSIHVCSDGLDNDGDGVSDMEDPSCRINLRFDMNTLSAGAAAGVQSCRGVPAGASAPVTVEVIIENATAMFGMDADILYSQKQIAGVTQKASQTTGTAPGSAPNFWKGLDASTTVFNGSEDAETGSNAADGRYSTFFADLGLKGPYRDGGASRITVTTVAPQAGSTTTILRIDPSTLIMRSVINGTVTVNRGIVAHNPLSIFPGILEFQDSPLPEGACSAATLEDTDEDGVPNVLDNSPLTPNPSQADSDFDGTGDVAGSGPDGAPGAATPTPTETPGSTPTTAGTPTATPTATVTQALTPTPTGTASPEPSLNSSPGSGGSTPWWAIGISSGILALIIVFSVAARRLLP